MFFSKLKIHKKNTGETLLEVLIAISILTITMIAVAQVIKNVMRTNASINQRMIAVNLAKEGIEAVRNLRDTNWLRFSGNKRENWLCLNATCTLPTDKITTESSQFMKVNLSSDYKKYEITQPNSGLYKITKTNFFSDDFSTFKLCKKNIASSPAQDFRYIHSSDADCLNTPFYRQLELKVTSEGVYCGGATCPKKLIIISRVFWNEENKVFSTSLETHLYDFFQRTSYEE